MKADPTSIDKASPAAGRPRDPRIDAAILRATADLLVEIGYSNLTMAAVADRAGTTKTALYRRWSSKAELVHEAAFPAAPTAIETPPGDITADIRIIGALQESPGGPPVVPPAKRNDKKRRTEGQKQVLARQLQPVPAGDCWPIDDRGAVVHEESLIARGRQLI